MVKATEASTVALWREMYLVRPNLSFNDYRIEWAEIQNEAEDTDKTAISSGSVSKYLKIFKAEALQAGELQFKESGMVSLEPVHINVEPIEAIGPFESFDPKAELFLLQSQLVGIARNAETITNKVRLYGDAVATAITLLEDAEIMASLMARAETAERELAQMDAKLERAEALAKEEREKRITEGMTHGDATGR